MNIARRVYGRPYLLLAVAALGWGGNAVAGRLGVGHVSPMAIVTLRWLGVVLVLAVVARRHVGADWAVLKSRWPYVFAMGALGYTAFNALFYWAAHHTSAVNMGVIQAITPALVMAGSLAAYSTPIRPFQVLGLVATLVGVVVVTSRGDMEVLRQFAFNIGDVGIVVASLFYSGYTVALRRRPAVAPLAFFSAMAFAAFLTSLPLLAYEIAAGAVLWPTPRGWALILFIALMPSLTCQLLYMRGVELIGPGRAGLFMNLIPVVAALLAVAILGETIAPYHAVALGFVLGGIWLAERGRPGEGRAT